MALPTSSLSRICKSVLEFLETELEANSNSIRVMMGSPAEAAKIDDEHRINLFFYLVEPTGFGDVGPNEIWRVRLQCLVTAFGIAEGAISSGENDLRLLGGVLRTFHERPILPSFDLDGLGVRLQVVFIPLTLDQINHIWSTQGDVAYRPSVAYEMALAPIPPSELAPEGPLVGSIGVDVQKDLGFHPFGGNALAPVVQVRTVATVLPDWTPRICLVSGGDCSEGLSFAIDDPDLVTFTPKVWVTGLPGSPVTLRWESWEPGPDGWTPLPDHVDTQATSIVLDPAAAASATTVDAPMPFKDKPGQLVLYAVRNAKRFPDGLPIEVRSNPVLIGLYEEEEP